MKKKLKKENIKEDSEWKELLKIGAIYLSILGGAKLLQNFANRNN